MHHKLDFGATLAAVPDVDGDGLDDLLVGAPNAGPAKGGQVQLFSTASWTALGTWSGSSKNDEYGARIGLFPDVNHDGKAELLLASPATNILEFISATTGRVLQDVRPPDGSDFPTSLPLLDARLARRFANERHPALATTYYGTGAGGASLRVFGVGDLFLTLSPTSVAPDEVVTGTVRGGPSGSFAGIYVVSIDDFPLQKFLAFGYLDTFGEWSVSDTAPPGLSGMTYLLRGYCVGFDGRLAVSSDEELYFE